MEFRKGANVYGDDGRTLGTVTRVVVDPKTRQITHLVISHGFVLHQEKLVEERLVAESFPERVRLKGDIDFDALPDFEETSFTRVDDPSNRPGQSPDSTSFPGPPAYYLYPYPTSGLGYPYAGAIVSGQSVETKEQNIPEDTVALKEGAAVEDENGNSVGQIAEVVADESGRVTHFILERGLLNREHKAIPETWVREYAEDRIRLCVGEGLIDRLPEYAAPAIPLR